MGKKRYFDDEEDDEDDEDIFENPFDISKLFTNPEKIFNSKQFKHLFKDIFQKIFENMPGDFKNLSFEDIQKEFMKNKDKFGFKGPFMTGFNINIGPDGTPRVDSFGNIKSKPSSGKPEVRKSREPLVEVEEEEDQITVIAEMPGVIKEDIEIKADISSLTITTKENAPGRNYFKEVALPSTINPDYAKARYTNGILEIKLKKTTEGQKKEIQID
jgi:HSP20 family protein